MAASTVGTSTTHAATNQIFMRKTFIAEGREWVFYSDGTDLVFRSRVIDPLGSWSSATTFKSGYDLGHYMSLWWDGSKVHAATGLTVAGYAIHYRSGTPSSDGTISWGTERTASSAETEIFKSYPIVCVDSSGYPVILWARRSGWYFDDVRVQIATATDGSTWGSETTIFSITENNRSHLTIIPLADRKLLAISEDRVNTKIESRLYNGSSWASAQTAVGTYAHHTTSAVVMGNKVLLVAYADVSGDTNPYAYWWEEDSWGSGTKLGTGGNPLVAKIDSTRAVAFYFSQGTGTATIYTTVYNGSSWETPQSLATTSDLVNSWRSFCGYEAVNNRVGLVWIEGTASPYDVRYKAFEVPITRWRSAFFPFM